MDNANSKDYLEKIKNQVIDNLRKTAHVPSVQMTEIPRTTMLGGTDEDEDILDDLDEDENKDARNTKRRWDQHVERDDEFEDSDDEEIAESNGVRPQNGNKRRNISDFPNPNAVASDIEMESGVPTPDVPKEINDAVAAIVTEVNAEVNAELMEKKALEVTAEATETGPSNAPSGADSPKATVIDNEGDIEMGDEPTTEGPVQAKPVEVVTNLTADEPMAGTSESTIKQEGETERAAIDVESQVSKVASEAES